MSASRFGVYELRERVGQTWKLSEIITSEEVVARLASLGAGARPGAMLLGRFVRGLDGDTGFVCLGEAIPVRASRVELEEYFARVLPVRHSADAYRSAMKRGIGHQILHWLRWIDTMQQDESSVYLGNTPDVALRMTTSWSTEDISCLAGAVELRAAELEIDRALGQALDRVVNTTDLLTSVTLEHTQDGDVRAILLETLKATLEALSLGVDALPPADSINTN